MRQLNWSLYLLVAVGAFAFAGVAFGAQETASIPADVCLQCHDGAEVSFVKAAHGGTDCVSCHRGADAHIDDPSLENAPTKPDAARCLSCHQKSGSGRMNWTFSDHGQAKVECRECHGIHQPRPIDAKTKALQIRDARSEMCASCHVEIAPRLNMLSHHPVKEGAVTCMSCHDPHGSAATKLEQWNATCTGCHQAVRGPHTFEHPPVVEDCTQCHNPHGSPNRRLLEIAQPMACLQCHSLADNRHGQTGSAGSRIGGAALRSCTTCHSAIHGSASDQHFRF